MESPKITRWEYDHDEVEGELYENRVTRVLEERGQNGWELAGIVFDRRGDGYSYLYFKRPLLSDNDEAGADPAKADLQG